MRLVKAMGLGGLGHEKRLPDLMLNVSEACQLAFLEGYHLGDGSKGFSRAELIFGTVSRHLANGVNYLLGQLGVVASTRFTDHSQTVPARQDLYVSAVSGKDQLARLASLWRKAPNADFLQSFIDRASDPRRRWIEISDNLIGLPVRSNLAIPWDGDVYDLSVADDEKFIAGFGGGLQLSNTGADVDGSRNICSASARSVKWAATPCCSS